MQFDELLRMKIRDTGKIGPRSQAVLLMIEKEPARIFPTVERAPSAPTIIRHFKSLFSPFRRKHSFSRSICFTRKLPVMLKGVRSRTFCCKKPSKIFLLQIYPGGGVSGFFSSTKGTSSKSPFGAANRIPQEGNLGFSSRNSS